MNDMFPFVYILTLPEEHVEILKEKLIQTMEPTRKEKSCIFCDLFQDINDPNTFIINELWTNTDDWRKHMFSSAVQDFTHLAEKHHVKLSIHQMKKII